MNMILVSVDLANIDMTGRLRAVDDAYARVIAVSMATDGQRTPIELRPADEAGKHRLIAGGHRVRAAEIAGIGTLQAVIRHVSDLDAERLEIEENLCRHDLTEMDRSTFLARWKAVYEALEGAPKHGRKSREVEVAKFGDLKLGRFTAVAADRLGMSERVIQRATQRHARIAPDVRALLTGTWLADHGTELDLLARMRPEVQRPVVALMLERGATSLKPLRDLVMGISTPAPDPIAQAYDALVKAWRRAAPEAQGRFAEWLLTQPGADALFSGVTP